MFHAETLCLLLRQSPQQDYSLPLHLQIKGIPFLAFDAGGVLELFDHEEHAGNVIKHATPAALASRLNEVLTHGSLSTVKLAKEVTTGQQKWLKFHADFAHETAEYKEVFI